MKTKTGIILPPKPLPVAKKLTLWVIDFALLVAVTYLTFRFFPIKDLIPLRSSLHRFLVVLVVYYFFLIVVPNSFLSQTIGALIFEAKVVSEKHKRLSLGQSLHYSLFLPKSGAEVIDSNHKKHRNGFLDLCLFWIYHALASGLLIIFLVVGTSKTEGVGFGVLTKWFGKAEPEAKVVQVKAFMKSIRGEVMISVGREGERLAVENEEVLKNVTIVTKDQSSALLILTGKAVSQVRLGANSRINIDDLLHEDSASGEEQSYFHLVHGALSMAVDNRKQKVSIKVKTRMASFAVRGTQFRVMTDEEHPALLAVKEGAVESENFISHQKKMVSDNHVLLINTDGQEKDIVDPKAIEQFDWDLGNADWEDTDRQIIDTSLGHPAFEAKAETKVADAPVEKAAEDIPLEIEAFRKENTFMEEDLQKEILAVTELQKKLDADRPHIEKDIVCISTTRTPCNLYTEKLLISRGFMTTFGTPRLHESMVEDLRKYMKEEEAKITQGKAEIETHRTLLERRKVVLRNAENLLKTQTDLATIIPMLRDKELRPK